MSHSYHALAQPVASPSPSTDDTNVSPSAFPPTTTAVTSSTKPTLFDHYFDFLDRWKKLLLVAWILVGIGSVVIGPNFFNATSADGGDAPGTPVYEANKVYNAAFPADSKTEDLIILIVRTVPAGWPQNDTTIMTPITQSFTSQVEAACAAFQPQSMVLGIDGYYLAINTNYSAFADQFISVHQDATMITVSYDENSGDSDVTDFIHYWEDIVNGGQLTFPDGTSQEIQDQYKVSVTGLDLLFDDTTSQSEKDFITMDSIVLPLALIVLAVYLHNLRLMFIPLVSVGLTLLISFTIMYPIAKWGMQVASFVPSIMVSTAIAMSIDYSLFLLTRFREEKLKMVETGEKAARAAERAMLSGATVTPSSPIVPSSLTGAPVDPMDVLRRQNFLAVKAMLRTAGHVVAVSGTTLMLTFLGLTVFPISFLASVGVGAAWALFCCLSVNLMLTPILLLLFPVFFGTFRLIPLCLRKYFSEKWLRRIEGEVNMKFQLAEERQQRRQQRLDEWKNNGGAGQSTSPPSHGVLISPATASPTTPLTSSMNSPDYASDDLDQDEDVTESVKQEALIKKQEASFWFRSARCTTTTKWSIFVIAIVLACSLPVCYYSLQLHTSSDVGLIFPRNSLALASFQELNIKFQPGQIDPFHIITTTGVAGGVWTSNFFEKQQQLITTLLNQGLVANISITAISYVQSAPVTWEMAQTAFDPTSPFYNTPRAFLYRDLFQQNCNADNSTTLITLVTTFNPDGDYAPTFVDSVRGILADMMADDVGPQYQYYLNGGATDDLDGYRKVNSLFPTLIIITVCFVFLIVAFLFKSFLVPLRLLFTIGLSITWVYGFAVLVFQKGIFNFVSVNLRQTDTIFWMEVTMTFSILVGLGLDYDVFLFSRVHEYKRMGYSNRACIVKAVYQTGEIITVAGTIMGIAFGGLLSSSTMVLNQFGFLLMFAVLFDTFVIRTLLVPAMLHLFGRWNWLPGKYPEERYGLNDFVEVLEGHPESIPMKKDGAAGISTAAGSYAAPSTTHSNGSYGSAHQRLPSTDFQFLTSPDSVVGAGR